MSATDVPVVVNKMDIEQYAKTLYAKVKESFPDETLSMSNVFDFIRVAMEGAEKFRELEGRQKKELVIRVIQLGIEDILDDGDNQALCFFVDKFADLIIDQFCDIDLNHLSINQDKKNKILAFFKKCCPCVGN